MDPKKPAYTLPALNQPKPVRVHADTRGRPTAVATQARFVPVDHVENRWRIHDDWWRQEIHREYWHLIPEDGRPIVVFHDLIGDGWYRQMAGQAMRQSVPVSPFVPRVEPREQQPARRQARGRSASCRPLDFAPARRARP
jgi:hypothetical protein